MINIIMMIWILDMIINKNQKINFKRFTLFNIYNLNFLDLHLFLNLSWIFILWFNFYFIFDQNENFNFISSR